MRPTNAFRQLAASLLALTSTHPRTRGGGAAAHKPSTEPRLSHQRDTQRTIVSPSNRGEASSS